MKVPRKLKKKIPEGLYCYKAVRFDSDTGILHTKECPMYIRGEHNTYCKLVHKSEDRGWDILFDDECKICGIKEGIHEFD